MNKADIKSLICTNQMTSLPEQVCKRHQVLERVVNIVKLIGKRALSYRGNKNESTQSIADMSVDHGNFLKILLLLSKYDSCLQQHITECIEKSPVGQGRGAFVTLMSKTTVNSVIEGIPLLNKERLSSEVTQA